MERVKQEENKMAKMNITKEMTSNQRLAVIRRHSKKFSKKLARNQRVRKTETENFGKYDSHNINAWTDAPQYAEKYYGDAMRDTVAMDNDWN
jgi:hypothetical protein